MLFYKHLCVGKYKKGDSILILNSHQDAKHIQEFLEKDIFKTKFNITKILHKKYYIETTGYLFIVSKNELENNSILVVD